MLTPVDIAYLWRPQLKDPADEMVLEAAANASAFERYPSAPTLAQRPGTLAHLDWGVKLVEFMLATSLAPTASFLKKAFGAFFVILSQFQVKSSPFGANLQAEIEPISVFGPTAFRPRMTCARLSQCSAPYPSGLAKSSESDTTTRN